MSKRNVYVLLILAALLLLALAACSSGAEETQAPPPPPTAAPAEAEPTEPPAAEEPTEAAPAEEPAPELIGDSLRGGLLYDKWWTPTGLDAPEEDHPLWATQDTNTRSGKDTWRCKECHGWDYKGVDGAYGSGSHMTGFVGVIQMAGADPNEVLAALKGATNPDHDFSTVMDEQALIDLALFISSEVYDAADFVNYEDKSAKGDAAMGEAPYTDNCAECHGPEGTAINFKDEAGPEYLGGLASDNPWEFLHKAHFGQPGEPEMAAGVDVGFSTEEFAGLLAYVQAMPASSPMTEGGLLYDKWWAALGQDAPEGDQPLWATQSTNTRSGADTWRCKECHGWDYKGVDGAYGSGSHMTGFPGILEAGSMSAEELASWFDGSANPDHDFSSYFGEEQVAMLVAFIQRGMVDMTPFINADKTVNGDAANGQVLFQAACARCHGDDGTEIKFGDESDPEFIGTIANDNPWEFFHKAAFGQPAEHMPSGINFDWSEQDIADLLAYAQTLEQ